jgi:hypothetical protein
MTDTTTTDFFDGVGGGSGAPSAVLNNPGDYVHGEIVEMYKRDYIPFENRNSKEPARKDDGTIVQQLVVILQTTERNWARVSKIPVVDPADPNSPQKAPSEDDGKRAVYVPEGKNIHFAIGRACQAAKAKFEVGGTLGVKIDKLTDTGKGNPLKEHIAVYSAPSASSGFFPAANQGAPATAPAAQTAPPAQSAPPAAAPAAAPAPAAQDPWATPAASAPAAAPAQSAPAAGDPWATPAAPANQPPF